jgi:hypothetical protein
MRRAIHRQAAAAALVALAATLPTAGAPLNSGSCGSAERQAKAHGPAVTARRIPVLGRRDFRDGNGVDYRALAASPAWREFVREAACLRFLDPSSAAGKAERKAFWINTYNSLVVHAVIAERFPASIRDVPGFFQSMTYEIGGLEYGLDPIEDGILRGNRPKAAGAAPALPAGDARLGHALGELDPRIHFALVCAARSCPRLEAYTPERLDAQLDAAARAYLNRTTRLADGGGGLEVSAILRWYEADFGGPRGVHATLLKYLESGPVRRYLEANPAPPLTYAEFDWRLNDAS